MTTDLQKLNREVAEWLDVTSYVSPSGNLRYDYPDYILHPIDLLREMSQQPPMLPDFLCWFVNQDHEMFAPSWLLVADLAMNQTGLLLIKVGEWMEES